MKILILGATGNIGSAIIDSFIEHQQGDKIIAGVRSVEKARAIWGENINYHHFDFQDQSTHSIFNEVDKVFFLAPPKDPKAVETTIALLGTFKTTNIKYLTFLSGRTTGDVKGYPLYEIEQLVANCGINYTILQPSWFMQNFLTWWKNGIKNRRQLHLTLDDFPISFIDKRDIGELGYLSLIDTNPALLNKTISISGPQALTMQEVVDTFSKHIGQKVDYINLDSSTYIKFLVDEEQWAESGAHHMDELLELVKTGKERICNLENEKILNRPLNSFDSFVEEYKTEWM